MSCFLISYTTCNVTIFKFKFFFTSSRFSACDSIVWVIFSLLVVKSWASQLESSLDSFMIGHLKTAVSKIWNIKFHRTVWNSAYYHWSKITRRGSKCTCCTVRGRTDTDTPNFAWSSRTWEWWRMWQNDSIFSVALDHWPELVCIQTTPHRAEKTEICGKTEPPFPFYFNVMIGFETNDIFSWQFHLICGCQIIHTHDYFLWFQLQKVVLFFVSTDEQSFPLQH
jgi:hypothetical protein